MGWGGPSLNRDRDERMDGMTDRLTDRQVDR